MSALQTVLVVDVVFVAVQSAVTERMKFELILQSHGTRNRMRASFVLLPVENSIPPPALVFEVRMLAVLRSAPFPQPLVNQANAGSGSDVDCVRLVRPGAFQVLTTFFDPS